MYDQTPLNEEGAARPRRRKQPDKKSALASYAISWIAALKHELIAALAMFDERHAEPADFFRHAKDTNTYHYGCIEPQNIVITSLGKPYGTSSAATTATELSISHPHIRFGQLVEIGAGLPRPGHDIRLGDVVVSESQGASEGVVQYDLVKAKSCGKALTGYLLPPPPALQKAIITTNVVADERLIVSSVICRESLRPARSSRLLQ